MLNLEKLYITDREEIRKILKLSETISGWETITGSQSYGAASMLMRWDRSCSPIRCWQRWLMMPKQVKTALRVRTAVT